MLDLSDYCREIEAHLCRKNDGHLLRLVGPSFEVVAGWARQGVPLKVALTGIDRYFERYYRKGPRRRPVKIDFCDADVLDVFDEWRRATGVSVAGGGPDQAGEADAGALRRKGPSLPEHLERVLLRLSQLRAKGTLDETADSLLDRVSAELDVARAKSSGLRGDDRRAAVERLDRLDAEVLALARTLATADVLEDVRRETSEELAAFRGTMAPDAFAATFERATARHLRERLGLPVIAFS